MYTDFFGLKEPPFDLTPSPRFVYLGQSHKEALALLTRGVTERKGLILLTGEIGSGKTTMAKKLLQDIDATNHHIYISNPILSPSEFIDYLTFLAFKRKIHFKSPDAFLAEFERFLLKWHQSQRHFILIVDESQDLSFELLGEIYRLSRLEAGSERLMTVLLVGQTEINEKLADPRCRAIHRQIQSRYHISPLSLVGTNEYVNGRLRMAGAREGNRIFSADAIEAIYRYSNGYPRMINSLAGNALLSGYARRTGEIGAELVRKIREDMNLEGKLSAIDEGISEIEEAKAGGKALTRLYWQRAAILIIAVIIIVAVAPSQITRDPTHNISDSMKVSIELRSDGPVENDGIVRKRIAGTREKGRATDQAAHQSQTEIRSADDGQAEEEAGAQKRPYDAAQTTASRVASNHSQDGLKRTVEFVKVREAVICKQVVNRKPVGIGNRFHSTIQNLHCFTRVTLTKAPPAKITHVWYFRDQEMSRVTLQVKSYDWRTNSSKTILSGEAGPWHVDILDPEGRVLATLKFEILPSMGEPSIRR
jgi:type II secretory pathway predicted ATPase ExeA